MNSSFTSKTICKVENLHVSFKSRYYRHWSLRDIFVHTLKHPFSKRDSVEIHALQGLSFEIKAGDRLGVIGVNGAGKTTLCKCLAQIYKPHQGNITIDGQVRAIFDNSVGIYPDLTGRENTEILTKLLYPHLPLKETVDDILSFSELGDFVDMPFKSYSHGMQARLSLSAISVAPSDLLILDEVFDGADKFFRQKITQRVLRMIENSGAVVFVSHSMQQILQVCNRLILINKGQVLFDGDPFEGVERYDLLQSLDTKS